MAPCCRPRAAIVLYNNVPASHVRRRRPRPAQPGPHQPGAERHPGPGSAAGRSPDAPDGSITVKSWREGSVVTIEVSDNGPGIPEQVRGKLFEAFQSSAAIGRHGPWPRHRRRTGPRPWRRHQARIDRRARAPRSLSLFPTAWRNCAPAAAANANPYPADRCLALAFAGGAASRTHRRAPVAQLDRAPDYESGGHGFESCRARQYFQQLNNIPRGCPADRGNA